MSYGRGRGYGGGSCDSFISCCQLQMHRYIYDFAYCTKNEGVDFSNDYTNKFVITSDPSQVD